jgi:hypothetical protein
MILKLKLKVLRRHMTFNTDMTSDNMKKLGQVINL